MSLHLNDAGTWRQAQAVYVNDAGTWRAIQEIYVNDAGTWRSVFVNDVISVSDATVAGVFEFGSATVSYTLANDGNIYQLDQDGSVVIGQWITPQSNMANYECFATHDSGDLPGGTFGAWQSLASNRAWSLTRVALATALGTFTVQIRRASDATVLDSASITLRITRTA